MELLEVLLHHIANVAIVAFEFVGVCVLIISGLIGVYNYVRKDPSTQLKLAKGMAMGLEFKLGSEILRTVIVRDLSEIAIVGCIIVLRAALTFLIHWEIKEEEAHHCRSDNTEHNVYHPGSSNRISLHFVGSNFNIKRKRHNQIRLQHNTEEHRLRSIQICI